MGKTDGLLPFIADHADHLARTAYLLTGDPGAARDLTVRALVTIGRRWPGWYRPQDAAVREIYRGYLATRPAVPQDFPLSRQSPTGRAAFVALSYGRLPEHVAAEVTGLFQTLRQEWEQAAAQAEGVDLAALAAVPPQVDVANEVMGKLRGHRRRRTGLIAGVSTVAGLALVGLVAMEVVTVAGNLSRLPAVTAESPASKSLPDKLTEPIAYAYRGYCENDVSDECTMWRAVTVSGKEWLVTDAAHGQGSDFHVTQDGTRIAYLLDSSAAVARDLTSGERKTITTYADSSESSFFSSPNGRFIAVSGTGTGDALDFSTGVSDLLDDTQLIAVNDDGSRLQVAFADTDAKLVSEDREYHELTSARVDSGLFDNHAALAADGHTLAVVSKKGSLVTLDTRTGKNTHKAIQLSTTTPQRADVERWLSADEVLVRLMVDDSEQFVAADVRTGEVRDYGRQDDLEYAVLGKLE